MAPLLDRLVDDPRWLARAPAQVRGVLGAAPGGAAQPVRSQRRARHAQEEPRLRDAGYLATPTPYPYTLEEEPRTT